MILPDKYLGEVIKYCEIKNIPIKKRDITRRLEEQGKMGLADSIGKIMCGIKQEESPIEEYLWEALKRTELSFLAIRQFEIGKYRIDFAFPKYKLAVECDGAEYHRANILQLERDQVRDKYLAHKGWRTLRVEGIAIRRDITYCIERIKKAMGIKDI